MRKHWTRLIQKVYHADLLKCPKCRGTVKIISFIEEPDIIRIIRKILVHFNLRDLRNHDPPIKKPVRIPELTYDASCSQLPFSDGWI